MRMLLETRGLFSDGYTTPLTPDGQVGRRNVDPYTLMLLIVGALRQSKREGTYTRSDFSSPFLDVLNFLSTWDMANYGMTVNNPRMFRFGDKKDPFRPGAPGQLPYQKPAAVPKGQRRICLQDVVNEWKDIGAEITTAGEFQDLCRATFLDISSQMEAWESQKEIYAENGKLAQRPALLRALAANYASLKAWRARLVKGSFPLEDMLWGNEPSRSNWSQNIPAVDNNRRK
ncbi:hypothetical protein KEM54_006974 [Ascosphaera aggregata]|nr:hypothetical protein KEM54_006974 [Ascosphaera aggregata]